MAINHFDYIRLRLSTQLFVLFVKIRVFLSLQKSCLIRLNIAKQFHKDPSMTLLEPTVGE